MPRGPSEDNPLAEQHPRPSDESPFAGRKLFTVEQANAVLPLVRAIAKDLAQLSKEVIDRRERLSSLLDSRGSRKERSGADPYVEELAQIEEELEKDSERLQEYVEELRQLGVEPKNGPEGLIDFPSTMDDRPIYLCWKLGEPEVLHWHDLDAGFRGRQALVTGSVVADGGESDGSDSHGSASHGSDGADQGH